MPYLKGDLALLPTYFPRGEALTDLCKDPVKLFPLYCRYYREYYGSSPTGFKLKDRIRLNNFERKWSLSTTDIIYTSDGSRDIWALPDVHEPALRRGEKLRDDCEGIAGLVYAAYHDELSAVLMRINVGLIHASTVRKDTFELVDGCEPAGMRNVPKGRYPLLCLVN